VLELVDVVEDDVPMDVLGDVVEAFLTSSTRDVQAVRAIDGRPLAQCPGPLTKGAGAAFRSLQERDLDP
jgi:branched-chain amino acid aminotransferase